MKKKYSDNFERDNKFYFENIKHFNFCGTLTPKFEAIEDVNGKTAKEVFYLIDSTGKNYPTCEPEDINEMIKSLNQRAKSILDCSEGLKIFI